MASTAESSKISVIERRLRNKFFEKYCNGKGIDIGTSSSVLENLWWHPLNLDCEAYEKGMGPHKDAVPEHMRGDATFMREIGDETYDWVYSSHCLEHIEDHELALKNWMRILKPGGYLIVYIPHVDYYERKNKKPSMNNPDHKHFYHPFYEDEDIESVFNLFSKICGQNNIIYINECSTGCTDWKKPLHKFEDKGGEYSIEIVVKKPNGNNCRLPKAKGSDVDGECFTEF